MTMGMRTRLMTLGVVLGTLALGACAKQKTVASFGELDGEQVMIYTLKNDAGSIAKISNYGGIVTELWMPDRDGNLADVVLGFDTLEEYQEKSPYFGAMVGRYGNRIAKGSFTLDGQTHQLATNNGPNHLHGGIKGFDKVLWTATPFKLDHGPGLRLTYLSRDGEEGYPGNLSVTVEYLLTHNNELRVTTEATCDAPTPVNIVHHTYWNLAGHDSGTILDHELSLNADRYTPADSTLIPTGEIASVENTPFDFREPKSIGRDIGQLPPNADDPGGFDMNYVVNGPPSDLRIAARVSDPASGRFLEVLANQPGIQFYSGNFLDGTPGKAQTPYPKHSGFCLESQVFPDSINRQAEDGWPNAVLRPGGIYRHVMIHRFGAE